MKIDGILHSALVGLLWAGAACAPEPRSASFVRTPASPSVSPAHEAPRTLAQGPEPVASGANDADHVSPSDAEPKVESIPIPGSDYVRGRTTVVVNAPIDRVRETVLDFAHYPEFMPHYSKARVLGRTANGSRDVYMEITVLHGALRMWARVEIPKPTVVDGVELVDSRFVEGNVQDFKAAWRMRRIDDTHTELSLEVFLNPKIPMPAELLNDENISGSTKGVSAMRARAEKAPAP